MDIKYIKLLSEDHRIKHFLSFFWDYELTFPDGEKKSIYKDALSQKRCFSNLEDVFDLIKTTFFSYPTSARMGWNRHREISTLKEFSELLYEDRKYWVKGTKFELNDGIRKQAIENYNKLNFLYDTFGLKVKKNKNHDLIFQISKNTEVSAKILSSNEEKPITGETVFEICECQALEDIKTKRLNWPMYHLMGSLSFFVYNNNRYWLEKNNLDDESVMNCFTGDGKTEKY